MAAISVIELDVDEVAEFTTVISVGKKRKVPDKDDREPPEIEKLLIAGKVTVKEKTLGAEHWKHFFKVGNIAADGSAGEELQFVSCKTCKHVYRHHATSGTFQFKAHTEECFGKKNSQQTFVTSYMKGDITAAEKSSIADAAAR